MATNNPEVVPDAEPADQHKPEPSSQTLVPDTQPASETTSKSSQEDKRNAKAKFGSKQLREPLDDLDWRDLEDRYLRKMDELKAKEKAIIDDYMRINTIFECWAGATINHEGERGHKRLRTRIEHVRMSERSLEEKREHYVKVVQAFQNALALLGPS